MYGLNAVAFVFFIGLNLLTHWLSKTPTSQKPMRFICLFLLLGNVIRYVFVYPVLFGEVRIPVEFSAVAYFVVPIILLMGDSTIKSWAAYSGLMAGFFYYMGMIFVGGALYHSYLPFEIYLSMFFHGALYLCGLVTISTKQCADVSPWQLIAGTSYVVIQALVFRPLVIGTERMLIYILLDGYLLKNKFSGDVWTYVLPLYYVILLGFILLSTKAFKAFSHFRYNKFSSTQ